MKQDITSPEEFIIEYRAALKAKLSRGQLANHLGLNISTIPRKRLKIKERYGTELGQLPLDGEIIISDEEYEYFNAIRREMYDKFKPNKVKEIRKKSQCYVITSAQNATPVHTGFLNSIKRYCKYNDAELMVIPYRYRNPTSVWVDNDHDWWHDTLIEFIRDNNVELCKGLQLMGHIKMQPTASRPLSGFDSYTGLDSGIFGHPKLQLVTVPTPSKSMPKTLTTTGAVTIPNYSDTKAGHKGEFHHSLAAVIVEVTDGEFHMRHIHGDENTGEFYDLETYYTPTKVTTGHNITALITGDTHIEFIDEDVDKATYVNHDSIVQSLKPRYLIYNDLYDFYPRNHWHRGNEILSVGKHRHGRNSVEEAMQTAADFLDRNSCEGTLNIIVKSNHDEAFDRWLRETDPKSDPENSQFYYYMKYNQMKNIKRTDTGFTSFDPFEFWCSNPDEYDGLLSTEYTKFLNRDESFSIDGIELGFHGDAGPNGSRGTINSMSKIGPKLVIGHSHTPGIFEGVYQVGLSAKKDLEYVRGPSSWQHTHCIIYPNGSRTLVNIINGKWRA